MKKLIILLTALMLVSCSGDNEDKFILERISRLEQYVVDNCEGTLIFKNSEYRNDGYTYFYSCE